MTFFSVNGDSKLEKLKDFFVKFRDFTKIPRIGESAEEILEKARRELLSGEYKCREQESEKDKHEEWEDEKKSKEIVENTVKDFIDEFISGLKSQDAVACLTMLCMYYSIIDKDAKKAKEMYNKLDDEMHSYIMSGSCEKEIMEKNQANQLYAADMIIKHLL